MGEPVSIKRNSSENFSKDSASSTQEWILCELNRPNQYYVPSFEVVDLGINPHKILFNTCTGTDNLGHIVWNEYSGADLLLSTLSQVNVPDVIEKVVVYLSSNYCSRFSGMDHDIILELVVDNGSKPFQTTFCLLIVLRIVLIMPVFLYVR